MKNVNKELVLHSWIPYQYFPPYLQRNNYKNYKWKHNSRGKGKKETRSQKPISQKKNRLISATLKTLQAKNAFIWSSKCRKVIQLPTCHGVLENQIVTRTTSKSPPLFRLKYITPHFLKLLATFIKFCNFQDQKFSSDF